MIVFAALSRLYEWWRNMTFRSWEPLSAPLRKDKERGSVGDKESGRQGFKISSILVSHSPPIHVFHSLPLLVSFSLLLSAPPSQMEFRPALKMSACERAGV